MICYFKGPYFVGVIITRTAFWLPVIIVHIHNFLTVIFYCYINVCTILKRFSIKMNNVKHLLETLIIDVCFGRSVLLDVTHYRNSDL